METKINNKFRDLIFALIIFGMVIFNIVHEEKQLSDVIFTALIGIAFLLSFFEKLVKNKEIASVLKITSWVFVVIVIGSFIITLLT